MIDFSLSNRQQQLREMIHGFAASVIRPVSLKWDREHKIDEDEAFELAPELAYKLAKRAYKL